MRPNTLLKVVSILLIVLSCIAIVATILFSTFAGSLVGMLFDAAGIGGAVNAGVLTGTALLAVSILGSLLSLIAGILGVKAKFTGCKVLGIIILVFTVLDAVMSISAFDAAATVVVSAILRLVLPVLYVWGAFKGPAAD